LAEHNKEAELAERFLLEVWWLWVHLSLATTSAPLRLPVPSSPCSQDNRKQMTKHLSLSPRGRLLCHGLVCRKGQEKLKKPWSWTSELKSQGEPVSLKVREV
jgi:hypothetical protein